MTNIYDSCLDVSVVISSIFLCVCSVKGGALVSVLYDYSQHRDAAIRSLLLHILSQVSGCGQWWNEKCGSYVTPWL